MAQKETLSIGQIPLRVIGAIALIPILTIIFLFVTMFFSAFKPIEDYYYQTTDVAEYGNYTGNGDNRFPQEFINSFFPDEIRDDFTDVTYSYRAEDFDSYGFEAYLEFTINDTDEFHDYVASIADEDAWKPFQFDESYMEYSIFNVWVLGDDCYESDLYVERYHIMDARIGKVLYSETEQKIIFVAIGVYDGGGVTTDYLRVFFERFRIDPKVYEQTADTWEAYVE